MIPSSVYKRKKQIEFRLLSINLLRERSICLCLNCFSNNSYTFPLSIMEMPIMSFVSAELRVLISSFCLTQSLQITLIPMNSEPRVYTFTFCVRCFVPSSNIRSSLLRNVYLIFGVVRCSLVSLATQHIFRL